MPTKYKIIKANDFLKAKPTGETDIEKTRKMIAKIASLAKPPADYEILIDVRESYGNLTIFDMYEIVTELGRHRHAFRNKIAVIVRFDYQWDKVQFLKLCAKNRGFRVESFTEFEDAIDWLTTAVDVQEESSSKSAAQ